MKEVIGMATPRMVDRAGKFGAYLMESANIATTGGSRSSIYPNSLRTPTSTLYP